VIFVTKFSGRVATTPNVVNFDDAANDHTIVIITYSGVKFALDKARLHQLLACEQSSLAQLAGAPALPVAGGSEPAKTTLPATRAVADGAVSHGSLSSRTKKIFDFASEQRALRPAHAGLLLELLTNFDWDLPDYPKTRVDVHLSEIRGWKGVPDDLAEAIDDFLERYRSARTAVKRSS
jgi:hypothetical protein